MKRKHHQGNGYGVRSKEGNPPLHRERRNLFLLQDLKSQKPKWLTREWLTCDHGTTEEIDGVIFFIRCGLEIDHNPLREGLLRERECQAFCVPSGKDPIFKRRTEPKKPKKEYIPIKEVESVLIGGINKPYSLNRVSINYD